MNMYKSVPVICLAILVAACASNNLIYWEPDEDTIGMLLDCTTANQDIWALKDEKARVLKQIESGVTEVVPADAVRSILKIKKLPVGAGNYIKKIDEKVAQIMRDCGLY